MTHTPLSRQIVVGVDGSAASAAAVRWAIREARLRRAAVLLICSYHSDVRLHAPYAPWSWAPPDGRRAAAKALLDRLAAAASRRLPPGRLITELVDEAPAMALIKCSAGAEMLVLGTTRPAGEAGLPPAAMGPVARACLRRAQCPVVVVAPDESPGERSASRRTGTLAMAEQRRSALPVPASVPFG